MKVLHIANDFCYTKVHSNLYKYLDLNGIEQIVFSPVRPNAPIGKNEFGSKHTKFEYAPVVRPFHRFLYHIKASSVYKALKQQVDVTSINLVHATTLFTDGIQAYKLYKEYRVPYMVAVRNTDINDFLIKMPHTWVDGWRILLHAEKIFFVSSALKNKFESSIIIKPILGKIKDKLTLMSNGIEDYYLDNINKKGASGNNIIYIGNFSDNKNVERLCKAVLELAKEKRFCDIKLTLIGGGQNKTRVIENLISLNAEHIQFLGPIYDKKKICEELRKHNIFAMPSITETFGLVYVEALSQGLAVLYTKGQGIDGYFSSSVGESVNPLSVKSIKQALIKLLTERESYKTETLDFENFRWQKIAEKYYLYYYDYMSNSRKKIVV